MTPGGKKDVNSEPVLSAGGGEDLSHCYFNFVDSRE